MPSGFLVTRRKEKRVSDFHFKKFRDQCQKVIDEYVSIWQTGLPKFEGDFYAAVQSYMKEMAEYFNDYHAKWGRIEGSLRSNLMLYPIFQSIMTRCPVKYSYSALTAMPEYVWFVHYLADGMGDQKAFFEQITTLFMLWFMDDSIRSCGDKAYIVKPDLRWALENTELKGFPSDELRLPFPAVYIDAEGLVDIYNPTTGIHKALGVYITEDLARHPRTWRLMLVGKGRPDSELGVEYDDALYHFQILFPENSTVDEAIKYTFDFLMQTNGPGEREVELDFEGQVLKIKTGFAEWDNKEHFVRMWQNLITMFKYVMNVMVYSTTQDADVKFRATSPAYAALRDRAMKAAGDKRRRLFDQLKKVEPNNAFVLGGSVVIDRHPKEAEGLVEDHERRKQRVRSLVSGHYRTYWIGSGRTESVRKWLSPFWRGPEHAPLTTKKRVVK